MYFFEVCERDESLTLQTWIRHICWTFPLIHFQLAKSSMRIGSRMISSPFGLQDFELIYAGQTALITSSQF